MSKTRPENVLTLTTLRHRKKEQKFEQPGPIITLTDKGRMKKLREEFPPVERLAQRDHMDDRKTQRELSDIMRPDTWTGHRCFIIGGGPSLKSFDWGLLEGELTIGCNRAFEKFNSTINVAMDRTLFGQIEYGELGEELLEKFKSFTGIRLWYEDTNFFFPVEDKDHPYTIYVVKPAKPGTFQFTNLDKLSAANNSGFLALNLACVLGANPIYLLGFDMQGDGKGRQAWWHGGYNKPQGEAVYPMFRKEFERVAGRIAKQGIEVVNLNPKSALNCFTKANWSDISFHKPIQVSERINPKSITVITPTGDRPLTLALCQQWIESQTVRPDQWLVVDDGKIPLKPTRLMDYHRREPGPGDPEHTLNINLQTVMGYVKSAKVLIFEDDEYYAPGYIEVMAKRLDRAEVAGIAESKYYHLPSSGFARHANTYHASLAQTGFRRTYIPIMEELLKVESPNYLDIRLWRRALDMGVGNLFIDEPKSLYTGMKGLPGRAGIGIGHDPRMYAEHIDKGNYLLRKWTGKDAQVYLDILSGVLVEDNIDGYFPLITGLTVCSDTADLMQRAYESVRKFHPSMPLIIIDGSTAGDPCTDYVNSIAGPLTTIIRPGYNIGHGRGMDMGLGKISTPYALVFDSDIEMLKSPVDDMLAQMELDTFGIGYTEKTGLDGFEYGSREHHKEQESMKMLHPYFQLISVANYHRYHPYVHHGAPCFLSARDIHNRGLTGKIIKEFPGLGHSSGKGWVWTGEKREFIRHDPAGTRSARRKRGLGEIEGNWVRK